MNTQSEPTNNLVELLEPTEANVNVLIIESVDYIHVIRQFMPNSDITVVIEDDTVVDKSRYDVFGIHWLHENYLSDILSVRSESFDVILGDELFLKAYRPQSTALDFASYLSETGYLVTSFSSAVYWQIISDMMKGHFYHSLVRLFTPSEMARFLGNAYFQDVAFMPVSVCADDERVYIDNLVALGADNTGDILSVKTWGVKAKKFKSDVMTLKRSFDKKIRWDLVKRLRRVEHGIQPIENTVAIIRLMDKEAMQLSYIATYIFRNIFYAGQFISNFIPGFYQERKVDLLRELLHNMENIYSEHAEYETVVEWKSCVDVLDEYPDDMLPIANSDLSVNHDTFGIAPENKVAFIACVNNEDWYHECKMYIDDLNIPEDIGVELIPVRGAKSMCQGYNTGMKKTNAKYKVYLHQDVLVCNKNIIRDMLNIFADSTIGSIGVIGAQSLPSSVKPRSKI